MNVILPRAESPALAAVVLIAGAATQTAVFQPRIASSLQGLQISDHVGALTRIGNPGK